LTFTQGSSVRLSLQLMNIAVYVPSKAKNSNSKFIVGTFYPLLDRLNGYRTFLITENEGGINELPNLKTLTIRPQPANYLLKKFWIENSLASLVKNIKADLFISADNFCLLKTSIPQGLLVIDDKKIKSVYFKNSKSIIVLNEKIKKELTDKLKVPAVKISILYPFVEETYLPLDFETRESIKTKFTEGKEYFLYPSLFQKKDELINLLKAYSHFKKRQQSSFKLAILSEENTSFQKEIENYKYRNDIVIVKPASTREHALLIAAAYALVLPFNSVNDMSTVLNAMNAAVPIITIKDSPVSEVSGEAGLYAENEIKDIGEKMMLLYKDETLRTNLIQKGIEIAKNFSKETSVNQLKVSIMKVMN